MHKILVPLLITVIFLILFKFKRRFELALKMPGPFFIPFIGNVQFVTMKPESVFLVVNEYRHKYKRSFRLWLGTSLWVFLHSPEETKQVLNHSMFGRADDFKLLQPLVGDGLLLSQGKKWIKRRKSLNPAFHPKILENFLESFCQHADIFVKSLPENEIIEISHNIFLYVLDTICETAMGVKINSQTPTDSECIYARAFQDASHLLYQRMVNPLLAIDAIYKHTKSWTKLQKAIKTIHELTEKMIKDRKENFENSKTAQMTEDDDDYGIKKKLALLDVLLNIKIDGVTLTDEDIKEEVNTFLFAGVDTTKSATSFLLYNLGKYRDFQEKIFQEISSVMGNDAKNTTIDITHITQMKYLDLFIKESLRYHTTVPLTSRQIREEILIGEMRIPRNTSVWINMYGLAHDPELFENPNEFIPERFDEVANEQHRILPYSYLPYAGGPRICIGKRYSLLMIKVITIKTLLSYDIFLAHPNEELQLISEMVLKSKNGINVVLKKRRK